MNIIVKILSLSILLFASNVIADDVNSTNITFGIYTTDRPSTLIRQFTPVLNRMEERMEDYLGHNVTIDIKITKTYNDAIRLLADGTFDFVRFGPVSYVTAKALDEDIRIAALESIGSTGQDNVNNKVFYGIIATRENSNINSVDDLNGSNFAFGNQNSTIGRYLAQKFLMDNDILESNLGNYEYLERHDDVGRAVADGNYDAGALKENTFQFLVDEGLPLREVARFPNVTKPWLVSPQVSDKVFNAMNIALLSIVDPKILAKAKVDGFIDGDDSDYDVIRDAINRNFLFFR